jgi:hypothetical protein
MSVWPSSTAGSKTLAGSEGTLVSISVHVPARDLEALLDALAQVEFPINPQIYHDASVSYIYPGEREETEPTTLVEFPAYDGRVPGVRAALAAYGFPPDCLHVTEMLVGLRSDVLVEPGTSGAGYISRVFRKHAAARAAAATSNTAIQAA